jgi:dihydroxy-acid dehydratase
MAIAGSTNAMIHLVALARRLGFDLPLSTFDEISRKVPVLANIRPSGAFLMEDFYYAGGLRALMAEITDLLSLDCRTVNGKSLGQNLQGTCTLNPEVIRGREAPLMENGGTAILHGSLAPDGAVIKTVAADRRFWQHTGPAVVFKDHLDMEARINNEELEVNENSVLILQNAGPQGGPGMPEWGMLPIPGKLLKHGIRDMVRISDARMSGTAYGTCVLHVSPESYVGGPLALVRDGDPITLDIPNRRLDLLVPEAELDRRRSQWIRPAQKDQRGYLALYRDRVTQADKGCDFDFLGSVAAISAEPTQSAESNEKR